MKKLLFLFILMLSPMLASADDGDMFSEETVEGALLKYTIISESEKTCMVGETYYPDVPTAQVRRGAEDEVCQVSGDITIPEEANGYRVVRIESFAFNQAAITSVFVPNSVKTIGNSAFMGCAGLKSVRLSEQLTKIEGYTFYSCESLTNIDIPEGVTSIGDFAFANCKQLKEITIPSCVEHFGEDVFWNTGFTSLPKLPESLTVIPKSMFYECTQLTSIEIPKNITKIGECAFGRCPISEIEIPANVTHVGVAAFANCKNITDLTIPDNVTEIGFNAFNGCSNLKTVKLSNNITSLNQGVFYGCSSLESVIIPNGVKSIGKFAFEGCSSLGSVNLPETLEEFGEQAFFGCSSLKQLFIPKNFVRFKKDENNTYWSFIYGCTSLTSVVVDEDNPVFDSRDNCNAIIETASNTLVAGCITTKIPEGITTIGSRAFGGFKDLTSITLPNSLNRIEQSAFNGSGLREITIPENVTYIGAYAFSSCNSLKDFYCRAEKILEAESSTFYNTYIGDITLHVPAASLSKYQAAGPWKNFKEIVALEDQDDYRPFVVKGKKWKVILSNFDGDYYRFFYELMNEKVEKAGKTYMKMCRYGDGYQVIHDEGLLREENRKVYFYDSDMQKEFLLFDYSLKAGDTYDTYSYDEQKMVSYKVLSVSNCTEGPEAIRYDYDEEKDSMITHRRYLRKWTVCRADDNSCQKTWIESAGSFEGPLANLYDARSTSFRYDLAYVDDYNYYYYLPFSFHNEFSHVHGCNLPTGAEDYREDDNRHKLTYELEGDRLHIYGKAFTQCGPNNYAFFYEKKTDDPLVNKIEFVIQEVEPLADCMALHATNFYVPGFDPNMNYIVVDNRGEEHPVINKTPQMDYRPFIEEGKVWKVGGRDSGNPVQLVEYYYFDGDTIINGKVCKQMMCQVYYGPNYPDLYLIDPLPDLNYVGAWYEEDKKVYCYNSTNQLRMVYDFSLEANDTLLIDNNYHYVIGPKQTGGLEGFKGVYRDIMWLVGEGTSYCTTWLEGVGGIDGPTTNVYYGEEGRSPLLMSCTVGDEVIYFNDEYEDGATPSEVMGARKNRFDFSHTIKTKPKAPRRSEEQGLYGEYNDLKLGINLDPLDDAYQVRITDESGKVVYEKAVNAGNIVGLNIDISAYEKGRYTVTVENSDESFTGEFYAQATGIEAIIYNKVETRNVIYNLQGQRLSSLQKGLNIVNGQKIFAK